jgi:predicted metalloprotease
MFHRGSAPSFTLAVHLGRRLRVLSATVAALTLAATVAAPHEADAAAPRAAVPRAAAPIAPPNLRLPAAPRTMSGFLTLTLRDVHAFWTDKLVSGGLRSPRVSYAWVETDKRVRTGCGRTRVADAFYCPADDTIYVSTRFAYTLSTGRRRDLPGAGGDLGVAYIVAHEYSHNIQHELGVYTAHSHAQQSKPFELEADCMAGMWANHASSEGILDPGDVEEAANTAFAVGDTDLTARDHHGTPDERKAAFMLGYNTGDLQQCGQYVAGA